MFIISNTKSHSFAFAFILFISCNSPTNGDGKIEKEDSFTYYVFGLVPPKDSIIKKCNSMGVRIHNLSCVVDTAYTRKNDHVDSVVKIKHGISIYEVLNSN